MVRRMRAISRVALMMRAPCPWRGPVLTQCRLCPTARLRKRSRTSSSHSYLCATCFPQVLQSACMAPPRHLRMLATQSRSHDAKASAHPPCPPSPGPLTSCVASSKLFWIFVLLGRKRGTAMGAILRRYGIVVQKLDDVPERSLDPAHRHCVIAAR